MDITNNTILITGGTSGIGFELAAQLLKLGNTVIISPGSTRFGISCPEFILYRATSAIRRRSLFSLKR